MGKREAPASEGDRYKGKSRERKGHALSCPYILEGAAGRGGGGPGPLEIEAAEVAGDVDDFADEEEAGDFAGFHGFAGQFGGVDATGRDFGFFVAFGAGGLDLPGMQIPFNYVQSSVGPGFGRVEFQPAFGETAG